MLTIYALNFKTKRIIGSFATWPISSCAVDCTTYTLATLVQIIYYFISVDVCMIQIVDNSSGKELCPQNILYTNSFVRICQKKKIRQEVVAKIAGVRRSLYSEGRFFEDLPEPHRPREYWNKKSTRKMNVVHYFA